MTTDNSYKTISYDELFDAIENDTTDNNFKTGAEFLYSAMTDWPTGVEDTKFLLDELKRVISGKLTYANIEIYLKRLHPSRDAWKMEAISSLLEMFNVFDKNIELENMVDKITRHYLKS